MNHGKTSRQSSWGETLESDAERTRTAALRLSQNSKQKQRYQVNSLLGIPMVCLPAEKHHANQFSCSCSSKGCFSSPEPQTEGYRRDSLHFFLLLCLYADRCTCVCVCVSEYVEAGSQIRVVLWRTPLHRHWETWNPQVVFQWTPRISLCLCPLLSYPDVIWVLVLTVAQQALSPLSHLFTPETVSQSQLWTRYPEWRSTGLGTDTQRTSAGDSSRTTTRYKSLRWRILIKCRR